MYTIRLVLICSFILLSPCLLASPVSQSSPSTNVERSISNYTLLPVTLTWSNVSSNITSPLLNADLVAIKLALPWYTSLPGGIIDYFIAFKSVTFDWDRHGGIESGQNFEKQSVFAHVKFISQVLGLLYTFIQGFAGVIHVSLNAHRRKFMRYAGAGAYTLIWANAAKLWTSMVVRTPKALILAWVNAILGMSAFIVLSLPDVGEKELYQLWSPWCTGGTGDGYSTGSGCTTWGIDSYETVDDWTCATAQELVFEEDKLMLPIVDYGFACLVGLLLLVTVYKHVRFWTNPAKGIGYEQKFAGYIAYFLILLVTGLTAFVFFMSYMVSKQNYITAPVTVCPGITNSTLSNITAAMTSQYCQCITVMLPGTLGSVKEALDSDSTNLARLIYNL